MRVGPQPPWQHTFDPVFSGVFPLCPHKVPTWPPLISQEPPDTHPISLTRKLRPGLPTLEFTAPPRCWVWEARLNKRFKLVETTPMVYFLFSLFLFYPENRHKNFYLGKGLIPSKAGRGDGWLTQGLRHQPHKVAGQGLSAARRGHRLPLRPCPRHSETQSLVSCGPQKGVSKKQTQVPLISRSSILQTSYHRRQRVQINR